MAQRVFIKVIGFSDEERHALNTLFRLSEQCRTMYQLWTADAPEPPRVVLLDAQSWEARVEAESRQAGDVHTIWVGSNAPPHAWRAFERPLAWTDVVEALDALFSADAVPGVDIDIDPEAEPAPMSTKLALIVSADRAERLYLRARLALGRLTLADEAENGLQAVELSRERQYDVAVVDCGLVDINAWSLLRQLRRGRKPIPHVVLTQAGRPMRQRLRAWFAGADALLDKPPHPVRFSAWLNRI